MTLRQLPGLTGPLSFDAHAGWGRLASRTVTRNDPTDPIGSYTAGGDLWSVGLSMTVDVDIAQPGTGALGTAATAVPTYSTTVLNQPLQEAQQATDAIVAKNMAK